jgi:hypothetical protein
LRLRAFNRKDRKGRKEEDLEPRGLGFQQGSYRDFHNTLDLRCFFAGPVVLKKSREDADPTEEPRSAEGPSALKLLHPPVDGLHSIDF